MTWYYSRSFLFSDQNNLAKTFQTVKFEENRPEPDEAEEIDSLVWAGQKAFGFHIKPVTYYANFENYSAKERMKASFSGFTTKFG